MLHPPAPEVEMYRAILVPVDVAPDHQPVFDVVAALARPGARVTLLHVIEIVTGIEDEEMESFYRVLHGRATELLNGWCEQLRRRGLQVECEVRRGRRGPEIVGYAAERGCDLVVLSSRPITPDRPGWGVGTISHQVALAAPCSVLLVR
jgi:nucleotide-binding universal stress UspA family protein